MTIKRGIKTVLSALLSGLLRSTASLREGTEADLRPCSSFAASLRESLPASVIVLGRVSIHGSGRILIGENVLLYPDIHLETQGNGPDRV